MKKSLLLLFLAVSMLAFGQFSDLAKTPPMGWNSWNAFALDINSKIVMSVADSIVSKGLAAAGYQYIVIDDGWQIGRDSKGKIIADATRFPEGIKFIADYIHSKGLKFGIYTCCGTKTCGGRPGSYGYEAIDADTYAEWGVDFIKEDWCFTNGMDARERYKIMSDAIKASGRKMLLSLCEWGVSSPWEWAAGVGVMWRSTNDIQDCFDCVRNWGGMGWVPIMEKNVDLAPYAGPGHWNDPDMLEVGNRSLNPTECRSHFSMWCMLAAPLIAGNNISTMDESIRAILTAPELIAIDQDLLGKQGTRIRNENGLQVWQKPLSDGSIAVALLNVSKTAATMQVTLDEIGFKKGPASIRDLWNRKDLTPITESFQTEVEAHGVVVLKIKGEKAPVSVLKFNQATLELNKGNHTSIQYVVYPSITPVQVTCSNEDVLQIAVGGVNSFRLTALREGTCILKAFTPDGKWSTTCSVTIKPSNIPNPWQLTGIKDDKASAVFEKGVFTIEGGGADIWGMGDQFAFMSREVKHSATISARVVSQTNSDPWAKTGLMIRENVNPNSRFVMVCVTPGNGISMQWRDSTGKTCQKKDFKVTALPVYLKLAEQKSTFSAFVSSDGKQWEKVGDVAVKDPFLKPYLVGMEVLAHSGNLLNKSVFDQVNVQ
jgi:alpha-galactosidase